MQKSNSSPNNTSSRTSIYASNAAPTLVELAERLRSARRPTLLVGRGVLRSKTWCWVQQLALALPHAQVVTTPGAKGAFPESDRQSAGVFGFGGSSKARQAIAESDVTVVIGTRLLEQSSSGWQASLDSPAVYRLDLDAKRLAATWAHQVPIEGDLEQTLPMLTQLVGNSGAVEVRLSAVAPEQSPIEEDSSESLMKPQSVLRVLNHHRTIPVCADAGNSMCWAIELLERDLPETFFVSLDWGTMGFALPAAIGIAMATGKHVVALTGDGSMAMAGGEIHTAVEYQVPVVVVVLNDGGAGMVRAGTSKWFPDLPELPGLAYRRPMDLATFATSMGAKSERVTSPRQLVAALAAALDHSGPTLLDAVVDPEEMPAAILGRVASMKGAEGGGIC